MIDYVMIRAWGQFMGSTHHFVRDQVATAHEDNAPGNVIYKRDNGTWATIEDVNRMNRIKVEQIAERIMRRDNPDHPLLPPKEII